MLDLQRKRIADAQELEIMELLSDFDKRLYPGMFNTVLLAYLSKLYEMYPDLIDHDLRERLYSIYRYDFGQTDSQERAGQVLMHMSNHEIPFDYTEAQRLPIYGWACILMGRHFEACEYLMKAQACQSANIDSYDAYVERDKEGDPEASEVLQKTYWELLATFKEVVLTEYDRFYKNR